METTSISKLIITALIIFIASSSLFSQLLEHIYPSELESVSTVQDFLFYPTKIGYAALEDGTVYKSNNSGKSWEIKPGIIINPEFSLELIALDIAEPNEVLVKTRNALSITRDGFQSVEEVLTSNLNGAYIDFIKMDNGDWGLITTSGFYYSQNMGIDWTSSSVNGIDEGALYTKENFVFIVSNKIYRSEDYGRTFNEAYNSTEFPGEMVEVQDTLVVSTFLGMLISGDDGITWEPISPSSNSNFSSENFLQRNDTIFSVASFKKLSFSLDLGRTWVIIEPPVELDGVTSLGLVDDGAIVLGHTANKIWHSAGSTFEFSLSNGILGDLNDIAVYENKIISVGTFGIVLISHDNGLSWSINDIGDEDLQMVEFFKDRAFAIDNLGEVFAIDDEGNTEKKLSLGDISGGFGLNNMIFDQATQIAYITTINKVWRSLDLGNSWEESETFSGEITKVVLDQYSNLYALGTKGPPFQGVIWFSANDGKDWSEKYNLPSNFQFPKDGMFLNPNKGLIFNGSNNSTFTSDQGESFSELILPNPIYTIERGFEDLIIGLGENNVHVSTKVGESFSFLDKSDFDLTNNFTYDENCQYAWFCGLGQVIQKISLQNYVTVHSDEIVLPSNSLYLYPNPTSDQLIISSNMDIKSSKILSIDGKFIRSIVPINESIDISSLPNGVYILSAISYDQTKTHKMFIKY